MEQFYGVLISVLLSVLLVAVSFLIRLFYLSNKKLIDRSDQRCKYAIYEK